MTPDVVKQQVAAHWDRRAGDALDARRSAAQAIRFEEAEWIRVLRPGGRLVVVDSQLDAGAAPPSSENARTSAAYAAVGDQLPFLAGRCTTS